MQTKTASKIETAATFVANTSMAGAFAYFAYASLLPLLDDVSIKAIPAALGAIGYLASKQTLRGIGEQKTTARSATFDLFAVPVEAQADELLLTDLYEAPVEAPDALVLDDVLAELGPDSRVVRLFDRTAMPTPAQLQSRIEAHLNRTFPEVPPPDASQALHEALAELRRSIG